MRGLFQARLVSGDTCLGEALPGGLILRPGCGWRGEPASQRRRPRHRFISVLWLERAGGSVPAQGCRGSRRLPRLTLALGYDEGGAGGLSRGAWRGRGGSEGNRRPCWVPTPDSEAGVASGSAHRGRLGKARVSGRGKLARASTN